MAPVTSVGNLLTRLFFLYLFFFFFLTFILLLKRLLRLGSLSKPLWLIYISFLSSRLMMTVLWPDGPIIVYVLVIFGVS